MYSVMFPVVRRLYNKGKIAEKYLDTAIGLHWITKDEKKEILDINATGEIV